MQALREWDPANFGSTDFKYVDGLHESKAFRQLKVWPVVELVNYGFKVRVRPFQSMSTKWLCISCDASTLLSSQPA